MDIQTILTQARMAFRTSGTKTILSIIEDGLKQYPDSPDLLGWKASLLLWTGDYEGAKKTLDKAEKLEPENAYFMAAAGEYYTFNADFENAEKYTKASLDKAPDDWFILLKAPGYYHMTGDNSAATDITVKFLNLYPDDPVVIYAAGNSNIAMGNSEYGYQLLEKLTLEYSDSTQAKMTQVRLNKMKGDLKTALKYAEQLTESCPDDSMAWAEKAAILQHSRKLDSAQEAILKALELNSRNTLAMGTMAAIEQMRGNKAKADEWQRLQRNAVPVMAAFAEINRANMLIREGKVENALDVINQVIKTSKGVQARSAKHLAIRCHLLLKNWDIADETLQEIRSFYKPDDADIFALEGQITEGRKEYDKAAILYKKAIGVISNHGEALAGLLRVYKMLGDENAIDGLVMDIQNNLPGLPHGCILLITTLDDIERAPHAITVLDKAKERFPQSQEILLIESVMKLKAGDYSGARSASKQLTGDLKRFGKKVNRTGCILGILSKIFGKRKK